MPERFSDILRAASEPGWSRAVGHRFVKELFAGAVPDVVMARYLIQDHRFLDSFLLLLGAALASADTFEARLRFGRFIGMVSAEENTYFPRAFEALGVTETRRAADPDTQPTVGFKAIMREAADTRSYAAALSVLVVAEWLYLDWASRAAATARQLRVRRVDHTARQSEFSRVCRFPARGIGPRRSCAGGSVPRLLRSGCRPRTGLLRDRLYRPGLILSPLSAPPAAAKRTSYVDMPVRNRRSGGLRWLGYNTANTGQFRHSRCRAARPPVVKMVPLQDRRQQRWSVDDQIGAARPAHTRIDDPVRPGVAQGFAERLGSRVILRVVELGTTRPQPAQIADFGGDVAQKFAHLDHMPKSAGGMGEPPGVVIDRFGDRGLDFGRAVPGAQRLSVEPSAAWGRVAKRRHHQSGARLAGHPFRAVQLAEPRQGLVRPVIGQRFEQQRGFEVVGRGDAIEDADCRPTGGDQAMRSRPKADARRFVRRHGQPPRQPSR